MNEDRRITWLIACLAVLGYLIPFGTGILVGRWLA